MENKTSSIERREAECNPSNIPQISIDANVRETLNNSNINKEMPINSNERDNNYMRLSMRLKQINEMLQKLLLQKELDNNKIRAMEYNSNIMFNNIIMMTQKNEKLERNI